MASRSLLVIVAVLASHCAQAHCGPLSEYYKQMVDLGGSKFPAIAAKAEVETADEKQLSIYLVVGDMFDFIGPDEKVRWPIDAMLTSTNVLLRFDDRAFNPTIQYKLRTRKDPTGRFVVSRSIVKKIEDTFAEVKQQHRAKRPNDPFSFPVVSQCVLVPTDIEFSPNNFCFVATDKFEGGTYNDPEWQTLDLSRENIWKGVLTSLNSAAEVKCRTFVTPLIGSSRVDLNDDFIKERVKRRELIARAQKSVSGIMEGIVQHVTTNDSLSISEIAIIVWDRDIDRIIPPELLVGKRYEHSQLPGGFGEYRRRILGEFDDGISSLEHELREK